MRAACIHELSPGICRGRYTVLRLVMATQAGTDIGFYLVIYAYCRCECMRLSKCHTARNYWSAGASCCGRLLKMAQNRSGLRTDSQDAAKSAGLVDVGSFLRDK